MWPHIEINKGTQNFGCKILNSITVEEGMCVESHLSRQYSNTKLKNVQQGLPDCTCPFVWFIYLCYLLLWFCYSLSASLLSHISISEFTWVFVNNMVWCSYPFGCFCNIKKNLWEIFTLVLFHKQFRAHKNKVECSFEYLLFFVSEHRTFKISHNKNWSQVHSKQWKMWAVSHSFLHFLYI